MLNYWGWRNNLRHAQLLGSYTKPLTRVSVGSDCCGFASKVYSKLPIKNTISRNHKIEIKTLLASAKKLVQNVSLYDYYSGWKSARGISCGLIANGRSQENRDFSCVGQKCPILMTCIDSLRGLHRKYEQLFRSLRSSYCRPITRRVDVTAFHTRLTICLRYKASEHKQHQRGWPIWKCPPLEQSYFWCWLFCFLFRPSSRVILDHSTARCSKTPPSQAMPSILPTLQACFPALFDA